MLDLSRHEATFRTGPPPEARFKLSVPRRKAVILDLLEADPNLRRAHSRLAPTLREDVFWTNYFWAVAQLRARSAPPAPLPRSPDLLFAPRTLRPT